MSSELTRAVCHPEGAPCEVRPPHGRLAPHNFAPASGRRRLWGALRVGVFSGLARTVCSLGVRLVGVFSGLARAVCCLGGAPCGLRPPRGRLAPRNFAPAFGRRRTRGAPRVRVFSELARAVCSAGGAPCGASSGLARAVCCPGGAPCELRPPPGRLAPHNFALACGRRRRQEALRVRVFSEFTRAVCSPGGAPCENVLRTHTGGLLPGTCPVWAPAATRAACYP